jgi:catechol O-methyltransferase
MDHDSWLTHQGTVLVADNVVKPGNPPYLSYVRASPSSKRAILSKPRPTSQPPVTPNPANESDWDSAFKKGPIDETLWVPEEAEGVQADGDPGLMYSSQMLDGWDPYTGERDACEVSVCTGRED